MHPEQAITTNIQLLRSSIAQKRPQPAPLLDGQAAINMNSLEPGLFFKLTDGNLTKIGPTCVNTTGFAPNSSPAGFNGNAVGETWFDGRSAFSSPVMKVWNGGAWLSASGFEVDDATGNMTLGATLTVDALNLTGNILPATDCSYELGSPTQRWANVYTCDLHLRNDRGDWTLIEEEDYLSLRNNKTGKLFKLVMEAVED